MLPDAQNLYKFCIFPNVVSICFRTLTADDARRKNMLLLSRLHYEKSSRLMLQLEHPLDFLRIQLERVALSEFQAQSMLVTPPVPCITQSILYLHIYVNLLTTVMTEMRYLLYEWCLYFLNFLTCMFPCL